jgi:membrane-associated phospholipid phosphatase
MELLDWISISVAPLFIIPLFLYLYTKDPIHIKGWIGLLATCGLETTLKSQVIKEAGPRPKGAKNCNLFCNDGNQEGKPGMPSGHSSLVSYFSAFYYQEAKQLWLKIVLVLYACLVMLSRYLKHCHSPAQIVCGALLGIGMNAFTRFI